MKKLIGIVLLLSSLFLFVECSKKTILPTKTIKEETKTSIGLKSVTTIFAKRINEDSLRKRIIDSINLSSKTTIQPPVTIIKFKVDSTLKDSLENVIKVLRDSIKCLSQPIININGFSKQADTLFVKSSYEAKILALQDENRKLKGNRHIYYRLIPYYKSIPITITSFLLGILGSIIFTGLGFYLIQNYIKKKFKS